MTEPTAIEKLRELVTRLDKLVAAMEVSLTSYQATTQANSASIKSLGERVGALEIGKARLRCDIQDETIKALQDKVHKLELCGARNSGYALAMGAVASIIVSILIKLVF